MADEETQVEAREPAGEFDTDQKPYTYGAYCEDPNWVPDPYAQYGTVNTSGTAGDDVHGNVHEVSPAFQMGRAQALVQAARALDPDDPTSADTVVLPNANFRTENSAREAVLSAARHHLENPVELGMTDARRRASLTDEELEAEGHRHGQFEQPAANHQPATDEKALEGEGTPRSDAGWTDQTEAAQV